MKHRFLEVHMVSLSSLRITLIRNSSGAWPVIYLMLVCCCCNAAEWNTAQCVSNFSSWVLSIDVLLWGDCRRCGAVLFLPFTAAVSVVFNIITALVSPQQPVWLHPQQGLCLDIYYGLCICVCLWMLHACWCRGILVTTESQSQLSTCQ